MYSALHDDTTRRFISRSTTLQTTKFTLFHGASTTPNPSLHHFALRPFALGNTLRSEEILVGICGEAPDQEACRLVVDCNGIAVWMKGETRVRTERVFHRQVQVRTLAVALLFLSRMFSSHRAVSEGTWNGPCHFLSFLKQISPQATGLASEWI